MKIIHTQGTRKKSVARATLRPGCGKITINKQHLHNFHSRSAKLRISEPLILSGDVAKKINIDINVNGGGINGQTDACRVALARALVTHDTSLKKIFDDYDRLLLVADVRHKEVRKPNDSKARASRQKSYR